MSRPSLLHVICGIVFAVAFLLQPLAAAATTPSDGAQAWPIAPVAPATVPVLQQRDDTPILAPESSRIVAQASSASPPHHILLWPQGLQYTVDVSTAWSQGTTGAPHGSGLPGGMDVIARWSFSPATRVVIGYYDLQEYPVGFSTGIVPVYLQGVATPIATASLSTNDATVQNHLVIAHLDQVVWTKLLGQDLPLTFSPTLTDRWGSIGGGTDYLPVEINGLPYLEHYRTGTFFALGMTLPLPILTQPKRHLVTTYTIAPQWAIGAQGANATNNAQLVQILHLRWRPGQFQLDLQPSLYPNMLPTDQWPQHYFTMIYSLAYMFGQARYDPYGHLHTDHLTPFVQATVTEGGAFNVSPYGISALYCQALPCTSPSQLVPSLGGNHAAQIQLKIGLGRPDVIPL